VELERWEAGTLPPLGWGRRFLPHRFPDDPAHFHRVLDADLGGLHTRRGTQAAYLAPRGSAKSTIVTLSYALRAALEGWEPYILILTEAGGQAEKFVGDLRAELEGNPLLAAIYPGECGPGAGEWRADAVRLRNGVLVEAIGRGGRIKGRRNRQHRPTLVILDDVQSNTDLISATERKRTWDWFVREVLPARAPGANVLSVGTALHREAVAVRAGTLPGWASKAFRAVLRWPEGEAAERWIQWERVATNLADPDRVRTAAAFFDRHRAVMDAGETYWPSRFPIAALMAERVKLGAGPFGTEYQQDPQTPEGAEFNGEWFDRPGLWFEDWPAALVVRAMALDPSKGSESKAGDYQAHVMAGLFTDGTIYVDAVLTKEDPRLMVDRALDLAAAFGPPDVFNLEDNDGLGMVASAFGDRMRERDAVFPLKAVRQTQNKTARVRRLATYFERKQVRFRDTPGCRLLVEQLREFPTAAHDDGPDSLELCIRGIEWLANPR
jgi:predicted phage terminase large subunit-like protein